MVPPHPLTLKPIRDALRGRLNHLRLLARPLAWGLALWAIVVALPFLWLYPGQRLSRPICLVLVAMPPLLSVLVASSGQAQTLLVTVLVGLIAPLVACPELLSDRVTGAIQGLAVAGTIISFVASALDVERGPLAVANERLRALLRPGFDAVPFGLGLIWLAMAWFGGDGVTARVAMVGVAWMMVYVVPLSRQPSGDLTATWWLRRAGVAALLVAVWGWWSW